jgi:probable addiction module antidote protein
MNLTPEQKARVDIDAALVAAGWTLQNHDAINLAAGPGVAVREAKMASRHGFVDYLLFVKGYSSRQRPCSKSQGESNGQNLHDNLGHLHTATGMSQAARDAGLGRESLYKSLSSSGNPELATILKVITALGLELHVTAVDDAKMAV